MSLANIPAVPKTNYACVPTSQQRMQFECPCGCPRAMGACASKIADQSSKKDAVASKWAFRRRSSAVSQATERSSLTRRNSLRRLSMRMYTSFGRGAQVDVKHLKKVLLPREALRETLLHAAAAANDAKHMAVLLQAGEALNPVDAYSQTPLCVPTCLLRTACDPPSRAARRHHAARADAGAATELLCECGADLTARDEVRGSQRLRARGAMLPCVRAAVALSSHPHSPVSSSRARAPAARRQPATPGRGRGRRGRHGCVA